ncbi:beta-1,3-glucan-binding protein-like [Sycon ciliatum]|uniref:beta-1,3-glucan-binding protein-like n=1 Tax=Sycon ciliatum TaxID=27933 RepID=UPI0020A9B9AB|eukprot:scpid71719/ scgid25800/ Beta-1,3-glucan-binding protein
MMARCCYLVLVAAVCLGVIIPVWSRGGRRFRNTYGEEHFKRQEFIELPSETPFYSWSKGEASKSYLTNASIVFQDEFTEFDLEVWQPEITLSGGGNWQFDWAYNNRSNTYVRDGVLYLKPTFTSDYIGEAAVESGFDLDVWGGSPADYCTGNEFYGCERTSGAGGNFLNPIQSMALRTVHSFNFKYGRMEIRAKLPKGDWIWPAIWLLPTSNQYGGWPASGEIDIMESRGNPASYAAGGVNTFGSTLHFGPHWPADAYLKAHAEAKAPAGHDFSEDFHVFGLIWNETYLGTYLDHPSQPILELPIKESFWSLGGYDKSKFDNPWAGRGKNAPFDQKFYLIFDMACGGTNGYFPDGQGGKPWTDKSEHAVNEFWGGRSAWQSTWKGEDVAMQIDYVRVYDR